MYVRILCIIRLEYILYKNVPNICLVSTATFKKKKDPTQLGGIKMQCINDNR
jgi:hypothetical protein